MYQVRNNRRLAKLLLARVCTRPAMVVDLCDAMAFIDLHGDRTRLWITAETAIRCAGHNPRLINLVTKTLENALHREGMLDQLPVPLRHASVLRVQIHQLCRRHHVVVQICHDQQRSDHDQGDD
jgi:hypothetical protein